MFQECDLFLILWSLNWTQWNILALLQQYGIFLFDIANLDNLQNILSDLK